MIKLIERGIKIKTLELLKIYGQIFQDDENQYVSNLEKFMKSKSYQQDYLKLKWYFQKYSKDALNLKNLVHSQAHDYWIRPILKINDLMEAFKDVRENYDWLRNMKSQYIQAKLKNVNYIHFERHFHFLKFLKQDIWELIEKDLYDIKITIIKKEIPPVERNIYNDIVDLYLNKHYAAAFKLARDIFQKELENKFKEWIQYFENKSDNLSVDINNILKSVSDVRNKFAKYNNFDELNEGEQRAFVKFSIELIIIIRDFVEILF